jgi:hypothetical protein
MGSESWTTWVKYQRSLKHTLKAAQRDALEELGFDSVDEAFEAHGEDGTASPLDIFEWSDEPQPAACWTPDEATLERHFGTDRPTRGEVEEHVDELVEGLGRGESLAVVAYENGKPAEVLFAGWSFD